MVVVVVSGMPVCGSSTTAKLLAKKLGLKHFSAGDYFKSLLKKQGISETEKNVILWDIKEGHDIQYRKRGKYNKLDTITREYAKKGNIVIDAKLGIRMLKDLADTKIWLKAPFDVRARRVAERDKIPLAKAKQLLREKEHQERENFKRIYGFDTFDQEKEADIVIDNSHLSPEDVVDRILKHLRNSDL